MLCVSGVEAVGREEGRDNGGDVALVAFLNCMACVCVYCHMHRTCVYNHMRGGQKLSCQPWWCGVVGHGKELVGGCATRCVSPVVCSKEHLRW